MRRHKAMLVAMTMLSCMAFAGPTFASARAVVRHEYGDHHKSDSQDHGKSDGQQKGSDHGDGQGESNQANNANNDRQGSTVGAAALLSMIQVEIAKYEPEITTAASSYSQTTGTVSVGSSVYSDVYSSVYTSGSTTSAPGTLAPQMVSQTNADVQKLLLQLSTRTSFTDLLEALAALQQDINSLKQDVQAGQKDEHKWDEGLQNAIARHDRALAHLQADETYLQGTTGISRDRAERIRRDSHRYEEACMALLRLYAQPDGQTDNAD